MLNKQLKNKFGKTFYLIGIRTEDNQKVWLEDFSWDCDWYWGGGYLEVFNKTYTDINEHYHINSLIKDCNLFDGIKKHFKEIVLTDEELWEFCDYIKSFYTLKEMAELVHQGGSNYTSEKILDFKDPNMYEAINQGMLGRRLIPAVRDMLEA